MNSAPNTAIDTSETPPVAEQVGLGVPTGDDEIHCLIPSADGYTGPERRASRRIPRTLEISVQPMDLQMKETGRSFFAITRDISQGGLAFLSSQKSDFEKAVVSLNDGVAPGIVCRICHSSLVHSSGPEEVWLTNVEYLHLHRPRK
ncbi:PilZ domain-containing protein [Planctomycetes bacterium TBK1r]|uniref:PilZ domain-containing protein n=1 Tax=Stieleria magnilauensis TaxID=2527963 RepID=A0ABX5Y2J9_9BACT|nr:hypothetical protein TBK1r_72730 [Planctomycetes bacterium TBK1r]